MTPVPPLLALRVLGQDHALEAGRDYVLGAAADCDLRVDGKNVAPHHVRVRLREGGVEVEDLGSPIGMCRNGFRVASAQLEVGDVVQFGDGTLVLVPDDGTALMVPLPALRAEAVQRRLQAARPHVGLRRPDAATFHDLMAEELHRAPWLGLSLVAHALLLLLLWLLFPVGPPSGRSRATVGADLGGAPLISGRDDAQVPDVRREESEDLPVDLVEPPLPAEVDVIEEEPPEPDPAAVLKSNPRLTRRPTLPESSVRGTGRTPDLSGVGSEGFRKTVAELKHSGLEIVFVFDSTGSMGPTIRDTKETISEMLEVLRALVPDARIGLVTYRDRGRNEDYVVRELPLSMDYWQAANFVQNVVAEGGGDREEAVWEGLQAAFQQRWGGNSKRVVILAGDAPGHDSTWRRLAEDLKAFVARGNSHVHAMITSPRDAGRDTQAQFSQIAAIGKGECLEIGRHERVLARVLELAFGRQFDGDLEAVRRAIAADRTGTSTWALDLSRRGGPELAAALQATPVDAVLLNALVRLPKRRVMLELTEQLTAQQTPLHTRHAIAWVLQRVLGLALPPADPITGEPATGRALRELRHAVERLPE